MKFSMDRLQLMTMEMNFGALEMDMETVCMWVNSLKIVMACRLWLPLKKKIHMQYKDWGMDVRLLMHVTVH